MTVYEVQYRKYSEPVTVRIVASTIRKALEKAEAICRKQYGKRVLSVHELITDVELAK